MIKKISNFIKNLIKIDLEKLYYKRYHFTVHLKNKEEIELVTENITLNSFDEVLNEMNKKEFVKIDEAFIPINEINRIEFNKAEVFEWYDAGGITNLPPITTTIERLEENNKKYEKYI